MLFWQAAADAQVAYDRQVAAERQYAAGRQQQATAAAYNEAAAAATAQRARSSKNVLYAVMALIPELADEDFGIVRGEIEQRLSQSQRYR